MQEFHDFEVIVVEDGSTEDAAHIIDKYKSSFSLAYYVKENGGQGFARNYAFERAKGDYFIILDLSYSPQRMAMESDSKTYPIYFVLYNLDYFRNF